MHPKLAAFLALPKITHDLEQGTEVWHQFRLQHRGASEAAAMLGLSKKVSRTELLHAKHTGIAREFSEFVQTRILDHGHEVEALARPLVEQEIGTELYPATCSRGNVSASCDGIDLPDDTAFEHKQWNEDLAAMVAAGIVPDEHMPQCQQILMVHGARRVLFVVSDGTAERKVQVEVMPDHGWWERIVLGWEQFDADLAAYVPREAAARVQAAPIESLPAVTVQVSGALTVNSNLQVFSTQLRAFVDRIPKAPASDQEFADADAACKALKKAEDTIKQAKDSAIAQVQSVESLTRQLNDLGELARVTRLATEKLVTARKKELKEAEVIRGRSAVLQHCQNLNERLGHAYMPNPAADVMDFAGCISGLKSLDSIRNAIDTKISAGKIALNEIADRIEINLRYLRENATDFKQLFPDTATLVLKAADDCRAAVDSRIAIHQAEQQRKLEAERERIRAEEIARLEREQQEREAAERRQREEAAALEQRQREVSAAPAAVVTQGTLGGPIGMPVAATPNVVPMQRAAAPASAPTMKLGEINARLAPLSIDAAGLAALGFQPAATDKSAKLYHDADFGRMVDTIVAHLRTRQQQHVKAA